MTNRQPKHDLPAEQAYNIAPQTYLRIPGLIFDPVPILVPYAHRAALNFLKPSRFKLDLPWEEYYDLLQPFDDVAYRLTDVFEYCIEELKYGVTDPAPAPASEDKADDKADDNEVEPETETEAKAETETETKTETDADRPTEQTPTPQVTDWKAFFERVLENLGPRAQEFGLSGEDVMWIAFLYSRAYASTPKFIRARDRRYYRKANIHYLHDLLGEWHMLMREKRLRWQAVFFHVFDRQ